MTHMRCVSTLTPTPTLTQVFCDPVGPMRCVSGDRPLGAGIDADALRGALAH